MRRVPFLRQGRPEQGRPNLFGAPARPPAWKASPTPTANRAADFAWTDETLDAYLADPTAFLHRTTGNEKARSKMTFKVVQDDERADIIAYLRTLQD